MSCFTHVQFQFVGPYEVRVTGPQFEGGINLILEESGTGEVLVAWFEDSPFSNEDIINDYLSDVQYSLGTYFIMLLVRKSKLKK